MNRFGSATSLLLAALGLTSAWTPSAHAAEAHANAPASYPQIHLDVSPAGSAVVPLLQAELDELGLTVVEGPASAPSITIHAVLTRDSLEVRISDDATRRRLWPSALRKAGPLSTNNMPRNGQGRQRCAHCSYSTIASSN